ncbi:hypothetical protein [Photobacterium sp. OFAV2-7]|uniref:hypothetical protein n=1 Tax=Photobacterium sp. OFAV2-7 TaxID=2917748 RepID=UPI001EF6B2E4|nr:hypothetical protein [Photobacterium sp. OFAV2-7]MCG7587080.1 hypothetical protein [Photobacterium sp. OFAV2-7]
MPVTFAKWTDYRVKLYPIIQQTEDRNNHRFAEEIDNALSNERAFLFVGDDGFMVLQPVTEQGGTVSVNIMFAYNDGGDAMIRYQPVIEQLARKIGACSVHFYTKVAGLVPIAEYIGYSLASNQGGVQKFTKPL